MAAQTRNLSVTTLSEQGAHLPDVAGTLLGGGRPQLQVTDAQGQCSYQNLLPGRYRLLTALEGYNTKSTPVEITASGDKTITVVLNVVDEDAGAAKAQSFYRVLTALQYLFLAVLGGVFSFLIFRGVYNANINLSDNNSARGLITFLVAVVTVSIALILVMAAFMSGGKDVDKRFAFGKEILTLLIGVLGTVMGFYYGQAASQGAEAGIRQQQQQQNVQIAAPQLSPVPKVGGEFTLTSTVTGGEKPYTYTITFDPPEAITTPAVNVASEDGIISRKFTAANNPALAGKQVGFKIEVKDKNQAKGAYDKGGFTLVQ